MATWLPADDSIMCLRRGERLKAAAQRLIAPRRWLIVAYGYWLKAAAQRLKVKGYSERTFVYTPKRSVTPTLLHS